MTDGSLEDFQYFDDMEQGLEAEAAALIPAPKVPTAALPDKAYLEASVIPLLLHGLEAVARERPADPIEYLAAYLVSNNPQRDNPLPSLASLHPLLVGPNADAEQVPVPANP
jgi:hypothetical protein